MRLAECFRQNCDDYNKSIHFVKYEICLCRAKIQRAGWFPPFGNCLKRSTYPHRTFAATERCRQDFHRHPDAECEHNPGEPKPYGHHFTSNQREQCIVRVPIDREGDETKYRRSEREPASFEDFRPVERIA